MASTRARNADECPKCNGMLEDDGTCSCGYGARRRRVVATPSGPILCSWSDHGSRCPCRGILTSSTNGEGSWYCREHWERLQGAEPAGRGNYPTVSGRSALMRKWDGFQGRKAQLPKPPILEREPGSDDDYADLVPAEAGQG